MKVKVKWSECLSAVGRRIGRLEEELIEVEAEDDPIFQVCPSPYLLMSPGLNCSKFEIPSLGHLGAIPLQVVLKRGDGFDDIEGELWIKVPVGKF